MLFLEGVVIFSQESRELQMNKQTMSVSNTEASWETKKIELSKKRETSVDPGELLMTPKVP